MLPNECPFLTAGPLATQNAVKLAVCSSPIISNPSLAPVRAVTKGLSLPLPLRVCHFVSFYASQLALKYSPNCPIGTYPENTWRRIPYVGTLPILPSFPLELVANFPNQTKKTPPLTFDRQEQRGAPVFEARKKYRGQTTGIGVFPHSHSVPFEHLHSCYCYLSFSLSIHPFFPPLLHGLQPNLRALKLAC